MYVIKSTHPAFGTLYLGRHRPVASKHSALRFRTAEEALDRINFWRGLIEKDNLDPKFFGNMTAIEVR